MAYRLSPVLSIHSFPSRATRSRCPSRLYRFPVSSRAVRLTFPVSPVPFSLLVARCPPDVSNPPVPFSRVVARCSPEYPVHPSGFPLHRALPVRRLIPSVPSAVLSRVAFSSLTVFFAEENVCIRRTPSFLAGLLGKLSYRGSVYSICVVLLCVCKRLYFCNSKKLNFGFLLW